MIGPLPLEIVETIDSTSECLRRRAEAGHPPTALLAARQTAGHGRLGRAWQSPPGNLHLSVLLRPSAPVQPGHWSLLAAVALAGSLAPHLPDPAALRLKWPNDLLLHGGKLAGILIEADPAAPWLVLGFGVNLVSAPSSLGRKVSCLADTAPPPDPATLARTLLTALGHWQHRCATEGFPPVQAAWLALGPAIGDPVSVSSPNGPLTGHFAGLGPDGALLLQDGPTHRAILSGEVE